MSSLKISEMPLADSLAGDESIPVVQSGTNRRVPAAAFLASWSTLPGKPAVVASGQDKAAARAQVDAVASDDPRLTDAREPTAHEHAVGDVVGLAEALASRVPDDDPRLTDSRAPQGGAGGVLAGQYPNPGFAVDMATQAELDNAVQTLNDALSSKPDDAPNDGQAYARKGAAWVPVVSEADGDVTGPASSTDGHVAVFDGTTGRKIKSGGALGSAAARNVSAAGDAGTAEVVLGADSRLTDSRTPVPHTHSIGDVVGLSAAIADKVDKEAGKGLSTNDYSTAEKNKLAGVETGANNYSHPASHPPSIVEQDADHRFVTDAEKTTWGNKLGDAPADGKQYARKDGTWAEVVAGGDNGGGNGGGDYFHPFLLMGA